MELNDYMPIHHASKLSRFSLKRAIITVFVFLLAFISSAFGLIYYDIQSSINVADTSKLLGKNHAKPSDSYNGRAINILIMGSDSRGEKNSRFGNVAGMRSDTTLILHISKDRKHAQIISIARDTLVDMPQCNRADGSIVPPRNGALFNSAFAYGGMNGDITSAAACTIATVEKMSGLTIDDFVVVDFSGFINVVDSLGGVEYCFDRAVKDTLSELDVKPGCQKLNGAQALAFARTRYTLGDGSDISRIGRQQELILKLIKVVKQKNLLTDLPSLYSFTKSAIKTLTVSKNIGSLSKITGLAYSLKNLKEENIQFITMPVQPAPTDINRVIARPEAEELWHLLKNDKQVPSDFIGLKDFSSTNTEQNENTVDKNNQNLNSEEN